MKYIFDEEKTLMKSLNDIDLSSLQNDNENIKLELIKSKSFIGVKIL